MNKHRASGYSLFMHSSFKKTSMIIIEPKTA